MKLPTDRGALIAGMIALTIALVSLVQNYGGQRQEIADMSVQIAHLSRQVDRLQTEINDFLLGKRVR